MVTPATILETWFPNDPEKANKLWWGKDPALDAELSERFGATLEAAKRGELDEWAVTAQGRLALVILLDQLSRNIYRGTPEAFAADTKARVLVHQGLAVGDDKVLKPIERLFFYLPLEHSEELADQDRCVALCREVALAVANDPEADPGRVKQFESFVDYAIRHRDIIARFGRFPHRNAVLGRASTAEELEFLAQPGSSF